MLTHYFELRAIPQLEITETEVINQVMQSLHQVLVNYQGNIAVSFPCYNVHRTLGGIIRLFGDEVQLQQFKTALQTVVSDYTIALPITPVPTNIKGYLRLIRVNPKGQSALRRAEKRLTAQGKWSDEVKNKMIEKWGSVQLNYPHLHFISKSTGQNFIMWIKQEKCTTPVQGIFNSYGLSKIATIPDF
ncbi:type I-F CRISPR-associated endoribonuclease Cas6/Csy4 [Gilliamella sp. B2865]|uniref:type I-F CRISPR-associated endoribonuclease Cas6/Csy4 n=1 Tax=unclassified Gilliamella TaxID=2685620 RepID=UPI00226AAC2D|nr:MULTISPECIES: type I-F CRISPR-associated endoribonuclease Cas6/Csy4 [unclassified Gilliamella]MCX8670169.1 type I-F CRISPR-associated endoribonuclease Cas6/Csy4 [Gilliamella sp. B2785]MCX8678288.1 type I-F CRISPR-associated endoribonuclease Cas6/Csy4 [Gilliamella sp. B2865]